MFLRIELLLCCIISFASFPTSAFVAISSTNNKQFTHIMSSNSDDIFSSTPCPHPFSELPGDPSLMLVTNVDLGEKKIDIMKKCSKVISKHTGKPEAYIGVSINDNASVLFGGTDDPCALGNMYSIGSIAIEWKDPCRRIEITGGIQYSK